MTKKYRLYKACATFSFIQLSNYRDRLKVVLIHDHANITPEVMEHLREDIIQVISKYMIIDKNDMQVALENDENSVALVANIPVRKMKHFR